MTRFARIHRTKTANIKSPEEATSWAEIKKQMQEKFKAQQEENDVCEEKNSNSQTLKTTHLIEKEYKTCWSHFEENEIGSKNKIKIKRIQETDVKSSKEGCQMKTIFQNIINPCLPKNEKSSTEMSEMKKDYTDDMNELTGKEEHQITEVRKDVSRISAKKKRQRSKDNEEDANRKPNKKKKFLKTENNYGHGKQNANNKSYANRNTVFINGKHEKLVKFGRFSILETDAERIQKLKEKLLSEGRSKTDIEGIIKRHRRNAEKMVSRKKKKLCFHCREGIHNLSECPKLGGNSGDGEISVNICYKCGSTEHQLFQCKVPGNDLKFAKCFICKEMGHLSKQCPDNPRGLYPNGGACRICGDVTHLKRDCPQLIKKKTKNTYTVGTIGDAIETLDYENRKSTTSNAKPTPSKKVNKVIKFQ